MAVWDFSVAPLIAAPLIELLCTPGYGNFGPRRVWKLWGASNSLSAPHAHTSTPKKQE